jgi:hypothetical protein
MIKKIPPCEVCDEARSRSRSNSLSHQKDPSFSSISSSSDTNNNSINKSFDSARSRSLDSTTGNSNTSNDMTYLKYPNRTSSKIYQRPNRHNSQESYFGHHHDPNLTYVKQYPSMSRSHDSLIRCQNRFERLPSPIHFVPPVPPPPFPFMPPPPNIFYDYQQIHENSNFLSNIHQELLRKLSETETNANNIIHKLTLLREYLRQEVNKENVKLTKRIENDRNDLIKKIELFEMNNRDLKDVIYDLTAVDHFNKKNRANNLKSEHDTVELIKQLEASEAEKNVRK